MGLKGEDISEALRSWIKSDVGEIGKTGYDIGKYLFAVASGSIGILASLQKLDSGFKPTGWTLSPYGLVTVALLLALNLVLPRNRKIGGDTDLHDLHAKRLDSLLAESGFGLWRGFLLFCFHCGHCSHRYNPGDAARLLVDDIGLQFTL